MSLVSEKIADEIKRHDIELVNNVINAMFERFSHLNGSEGILVDYVRDEIKEVRDVFINHLAN